MKAVGVRELGAARAGTLGLAAATAAMQHATRRYAKRQLTWLRHQMPAPGAIAAGTLLPSWTVEGVPDAQLSESLKVGIFNFIRHCC
jgi:tRNA dimethylallyltransferase